MNATAELKQVASYGADYEGPILGRVLTAAEMYINWLIPIRPIQQAIVDAGLTPNASDAHQLYQIVAKKSTEVVYRVGSFHEFMDHVIPSVWDPANPDNYLPVLNLSAISGQQIIDSSGVSAGLNLTPITKLVSAPFVNYLRGIKVALNRGIVGSEYTDLSIASFTGGLG